MEKSFAFTVICNAHQNFTQILLKNLDKIDDLLDSSCVRSYFYLLSCAPIVFRRKSIECFLFQFCFIALMRPFVLYTRCLWTCRKVFVMSTWYEILVDFISSCRESGKMNAMLFIFSRLCSPRGAGLIPSWMTPTFWFTVTFPVLFTEKGMAICFPR